MEATAVLVEAKATLEAASEVITLRTAIIPGLNFRIVFYHNWLTKTRLFFFIPCRG